MYILYCVCFIMISIFEFVVAKCIKDIYTKLELIDFLDKIVIYSDDITGDSDE